MRAFLIATVCLAALAACDSSGLDSVPPPPPAGVDTLGTVRLDPRATYLRVSDDPDAQPAVAVRLDSLGATVGDQITFFVIGYATLDPTSSTDRSRDVLGVFAASDRLDAPEAAARVLDALNAGPDIVSDSTALGRHATDIPEDFFATRATVAVPPGATHLFLALHDVFYSDNVDVGEGVQVTFLRR